MEQNNNIRRKIKVSHVKKDEGVFETGLEVVEKEYELEEDAAGNLLKIRQFYRDGVLNKKQM